MIQDSDEGLTIVPTPWPLLWACWSDTESPPMDIGNALAAVNGGSRLWLAPGGSPMDAEVTGRSDCIPFALRSAHPDSITVSPVDTRYLLAVRVYASEDDRDEFRRWLDEEHARRQVSLPGVNWYLGYEQANGGHSFLNLWGIDDPAVVDSEAWARIRDTEWWARLSHVPAGADRGVYRTVDLRTG